MDEEVKLTRGNERINRLARRPDIAADVARSGQTWPRRTAPTP